MLSFFNWSKAILWILFSVNGLWRVRGWRQNFTISSSDQFIRIAFHSTYEHHKTDSWINPTWIKMCFATFFSLASWKFFDNKKKQTSANKEEVLKRLRSDKGNIALKIIILQSLCSFFVESFLHFFQLPRRKSFAEQNKFFCRVRMNV